jgi:hypothetical protein
MNTHSILLGFILAYLGADLASHIITANDPKAGEAKQVGACVLGFTAFCLIVVTALS